MSISVYSKIKYNLFYNFDYCDNYDTLLITLTEEESVLWKKYYNIILNSVTYDSRYTNYCVTGGRLNAYKCLQYFHNHSFTYNQYSNTQHIAICECGFEKFEDHFWVIQIKSLINNKRRCNKCGIVSLS